MKHKSLFAKMRLMLALALLLAASRSTTAQTAGALTDHQIEHDGLARTYKKYVPDNLPSSPVPLVIVFHGGGGNADETSSPARASYHWRAIADREKLIVIYPNGVNNHWHDCRSDAHDIIGNADDVGFVDALITSIAAEHSLDLTRVYATGASNGGMMSYRLAFELSNRIAAIGAVVANLPVDPAGECRQPANPITVVIMNGTADPLMPFGGGDVASGRGAVMSTPATRDFWTDFNGTSPAPVIENLPDVDASDGSTITKQAFSGGREGTEVIFFRVNGGGHAQPSLSNSVVGVGQNHDIESAEEIWNVLKQHALRSIAGEPRITGAEVAGKKLIVTGENFDTSAVIMIGGNDVKTKNDSESPTARLIAKKGGKKIEPGEKATLQVRNSNGLLSAPFEFTRPD